MLAQIKTIGLPLIQNFNKSQYNADSQNWDIIEDKNGFIYVGNNEGVLQFDGDEWNLYPVTNNSIVRSLALGNDNQIYVGAYNELGRLIETSSGALRYESLLDKIPEEYRIFDDVWRTFQSRYGLIFQSFEYVFILENGFFKVITPSDRFGFSFYINNNFYIIDKGIGLCIYQDDKLTKISDDPVFINNEIRFILPFKSNKLLIGTLAGGFYILTDSQLEKWNTEADEILLENKIFSAIKLNDAYALGSIKDGLFFINESGKVIQHINRRRGLQNNTVLSLYKDRTNNIWIGLDNGLDYAKSSLPVSILNYNYNIEATYTSIVYEGRLYVGTNQGLFAQEMDHIADVQNIEFQMVENTEGQVWNLTIIDNQLFCGHNKGAFLINGMNSRLIYNKRGVWNFVQPSNHDDLVIAGTYDGIVRFVKNKAAEWSYDERVEGIDISVRDLIEDKNGNFWLNHGYKGVYRLTFSHGFRKIVSTDLYNSSHRLPSKLPYFIHQVNDQLFFSTSNGIYQYNMVQDNFLRPKNLNDFYAGLGLIYKLYQDAEGNIWYFTENNIGVFKLLEDGNYVNIFTPFRHLHNSLMGSFSNINVYDRENIFIGTKDGLVHYNPDINKEYFYPIESFIKKIFISESQDDSLWLEKGHIFSEEITNTGNYTVPYNQNTLHFTYTSNDMENNQTSEFRIRLDGFADGWSDWTLNNDKEYTNLWEGQYVFEVQTRNIYGNTSEVTRFGFIVKPPFYRSVEAYIFYIALLLGIIIFIVVYIVKRIEKERNLEKQKQKKKFQIEAQQLKEENVIAEKELIRLRNEQLRSNMKHKNKELANATYHIIQKNKFLNKLKDELRGLSRKAKSELVETELKKISQKIDKDIRNEQSWSVFNQYFDEVHQEFMNRLKENYPQLTPKDLRLCGYLRMNISTKEIAPLLNISVRGVEISRYRLRKKLDLDHDDNLIEYLLNY